MKRLFFLFLTLNLPVSWVLAQELIKPRDVNHYLGKEVIIVGKITSIEAPDSLSTTKFILSADSSNNEAIILIPINANTTGSDSSLAVGQKIMVEGLVKFDKVFYVELKKIRNLRKTITNVVLLPPPNAHYWGEEVANVNLADLSKHVGDTVKTSDKIFGCQSFANAIEIYLGAAYPNQKLTVILKGDAKEYLTAMITVNGKGKSGPEYLYMKTLAVISKVTMLNGKPVIVVEGPNSFIIVDR